MSVIKEAGPYVVALAGMVVGYLGGRRTGRESRHHGRTENLYHDMLAELEGKSRKGLRELGRERHAQRPPSPASGKLVSTIRVRLYASPQVAELWWRAAFYLDLLERVGAGSRQQQADAVYLYDDAEDRLWRAMQKDLAVPQGQLVWRTVVRYLAYKERRTRRREIRHRENRIRAQNRGE